MKRFLSRFRPKYIRSLVYMLQASEYNIQDYLSWYSRVIDFSNVEKRKQLVKTTKTRLLMIMGWCLVFGVLILGGYSLWQQTSKLKYAELALLVLVIVYVVPYLLIAVLLLLKAIQWPIEQRIIQRSQNKLKNHTGLKIAIAGSFGKTSMREILKTVLSEGKKVGSPPHSYNTPLGISQFIDNLIGDEEILIFELGEYYPGDVKKLCELVNPDMGVITGVNEAHFQKFKNISRTTDTIFELSDWLKDKPLYVNAESAAAFKRANSGHILYDRHSVGSLKVQNSYSNLDGTNFTVQFKDHVVEFKSKLLGLHQLGALLASMDIALKLGFTDSQIQKGISNTKPFEHRLEPKTDKSGVITLDDSYNGNPDGVKAIIEFLSGLQGHRRFYVSPGLVEMGSKTEQVHLIIGQQLAEAGIEQVVLIRNSVTPFIAKGLESSGFKGTLTWFDDALQAFAALPHMTVKGDVILLQNDWPDQYA